MAGVGAIVGGLVSFSALFGYNPVWWLCLFILIAGVPAQHVLFYSIIHWERYW